jgi:hypothetical protein
MVVVGLTNGCANRDRIASLMNKKSQPWAHDALRRSIDSGDSSLLALQQLGDAKIEQQYVAGLSDQNIGGFQVPVKYGKPSISTPGS